MEANNFNYDNILDQQDIENLFSDQAEEDTQQEPEPSGKENTGENTEVDKDSLFEPLESVGDGENQGGESGNANTDNGDTSPTTKIYSSIAKALFDDGVFQNLEITEEDIANIKTSDDFIELYKRDRDAGLDDAQRRINEALNANVQPSIISNYERTIQFLNNITEEQLNEETEQAEELRKNLIAQDYQNRGYSEERINRELKKSFDSGNDKEDALEALRSNIEFYTNGYNEIINEAKKAQRQEIENRKKQAENLKNSIFDEKDMFGKQDVNRTIRQRAFDAISKPFYKDPETGNQYTELQKYQNDNPIEYIKNISILFALTNGFKNIEGLFKNEVKKKVKKGFSELENKLNGTSRNSDGSLRFVTGTDDDNNFFKGIKLDL